MIRQLKKCYWILTVALFVISMQCKVTFSLARFGALATFQELEVFIIEYILFHRINA